MTKAAARAAESLNGAAAKVLAVVPIAEAWTVSQICTELYRKGSRYDVPVVRGCLTALGASGHVREHPAGYFQRTTVASIDEAAPQPAQYTPPPQPAPAPAKVVPMPVAERLTEREPLESIGVLAQRLRETGRALIMWAEDLERLGLEFETRVDAAGKDGEKLRQLQALLKSLG
jgi:hypothetical protein